MSAAGRNPVFMCEGHPDCDDRFNRIEEDLRMAMERDERRNADLMKEVKEIGGDLREMKGKGAGSSLFFNTLISAIAALAAVVAIFRH